ncbi:MAG: cytochrome P450 [Verrucomicrobia bacterium]|nr:cytochrome P450 [Verrucomicrobiota bacterium]
MSSFDSIPHYDRLGLDHSEYEKEIEQFDHLTAYEKLGPIYRVFYRGEDWVCVGGLKANEWAWGHPDRWNYEDPQKGFREVMGSTHVTQMDGPAHRAKRKALKPGFAMSLIARQIPTIDAVVRQFLTERAGETWSLMDLFMEALTEANSKSVLIAELSGEERRKFIKFEEEFLPGITKTAEQRKVYYGRSDFLELKAFVFGYLRTLVEKRLAGHREEDNFQTIIDHKEERESLPDIDEWIPEAYLLLMAGTGNTARTLNCGLRYLQEDPDWYQQLQEEVSDYEPEHLLRGMDRFPKLKATIMEMERIFPAAPVMPRLCAQDLEFEGYDLPAGTRVLHLHTLTHFLDEIYEESSRFKPSRWIENEYPKKAHGTFGGSSHICLGMNLARIHMPIVMANLIRNFDLELDALPDIEVNFNYGARQSSDLIGRLQPCTTVS